MGYDLHVTRRQFWSDEDGPVISLAEWQRYMNGDAQIEADEDNPGPENAVFATHPERWPLWWPEPGEVFTKNPDPLVIAKLVEIAVALNARVQGDDGEVYGLDPGDPTKAVPL